MKDFLKKLFHMHTWVDNSNPYVAGGRYDIYVDQKCSECPARRSHLIKNHYHTYSKWNTDHSIFFEERSCLTCGTTERRRIENCYL